MIKIITDTATLYSPEDANRFGFDAAPFNVTIQGETLHEYQDIATEEFVQRLRQGHSPRFSQPSVSAISDLFQKHSDDEIIDISLANGLSATYHTNLLAAEKDAHPERITVVDSQTLCGPQRYMVEKAVNMANSGSTKKEIMEELNLLIQDNESFLIPSDFNFLIKGGRLSPIAGHIGKWMKAVPVITQSSNRRKLEKYDIKRNLSDAVESIGKALLKKKVNDKHKIYISHAYAESAAQKTIQKLKDMGIHAEFELHTLSPVCIAQAGIGSMAVQCIRL